MNSFYAYTRTHTSIIIFQFAFFFMSATSTLSSSSSSVNHSSIAATIAKNNSIESILVLTDSPLPDRIANWIRSLYIVDFQDYARIYCQLSFPPRDATRKYCIVYILCHKFGKKGFYFTDSNGYYGKENDIVKTVAALVNDVETIDEVNAVVEESGYHVYCILANE